MELVRENSLTTVVGYIYLSSKSDIARDVEFKAQHQKLINFCAERKWNLRIIYREAEGINETHRPEFIRMIYDMEAEGAKLIVVLGLDKIGNIEFLKKIVEDNADSFNYKLYSIAEDTLVDLSFSDNNKVKKFKEVDKKIVNIPSLPEIVTKVMDLVRDPKSSAGQLSKVISCDPGLTSRVLRLVNSAYYGFPRQISSIQQAVAMVGFATIRGLVLSSSIFRIFTPKSAGERAFDYKRFWKHSLYTSIAAKQINKYLYHQEDQDLFSAAMLHDIGKIILEQYDHDNYIQAYNEINDIFDSDLVVESERKYCIVSHAEMGSFVAEKWNLPQTINDSILYHHNPLEMKEINPVVVIIYMANIFSNAYLEDVDVFFEMFDPLLMEFMNIDKEKINKLNEVIKEEFDNAAQMETLTDDTI